MCLADERLPDAGEGICCMGAAVFGPGRCTCWEPVYDQAQAPAQEGPMQARARMCADCAFRPGSPEQLGDRRFAHSGEGELVDVVLGDSPFVCHQGMRRRLGQHIGSQVRGIVRASINGIQEADGSIPFISTRESRDGPRGCGPFLISVGLSRIVAGQRSGKGSGRDPSRVDGRPHDGSAAA